MIFYPSILAKANDISYNKFISSYFDLLKKQPSEDQILEGQKAEEKVREILGDNVEAQVMVEYPVGPHLIRGRIDFMDSDHLYEVKHMPFPNKKIAEYATKQLTLYHHMMSDKKLIIVLVSDKTIEFKPVSPLLDWKEKIFNYIKLYKEYW